MKLFSFLRDRASKKSGVHFERAAHRIPTKPYDYVKQLQRLRKTKTVKEIADLLEKSPMWIERRLSLLAIKDQYIIADINDGLINISNAIKLSSLPIKYHTMLCEQAKDLSCKNFQKVVQEIQSDH